MILPSKRLKAGFGAASGAVSAASTAGHQSQAAAEIVKTAGPAARRAWRCAGRTAAQKTAVSAARTAEVRMVGPATAASV